MTVVTTPLATTLAFMALVATLLPTTLIVAGLARRRGWLDGELARKSVHVTLGLSVCAFPFMFEARWPVWTLAGMAATALLTLRAVPAVRARFGQSLHDVERRSLGELYFPVAAALVWHQFPGDLMRFSIPFLVLATADATAALAGSRYGRSRYTTLEGAKTWLGSVTFYLTASMVTLLAALHFGGLSFVKAALLAHLVASLLMVVEALAWHGLDNLFIPVLGALLVDSLLTRSVDSMAIDAVVATALLVLCLMWRKRSSLDDSAVMGGALFAYVTFVVGGMIWVLAPLTVFLTYAAVPPLRRLTSDRPHNIFALIAVTGGGFIWLIAHRLVPTPLLQWPFIAAFAAQLACIGVAQIAYARPHWSMARVNLTAAGIAVTLVALPSTWLINAPHVPWQLPAGVLMAAPLGALLFSVMQPHIRDTPDNAARWWRQGACPLVVSALVYPWT